MIVGSDNKAIKKNEERWLEFLRKAAEGWETYHYSGRFMQAVHMQYDYSLKVEAQEIYMDYGATYLSLMPFVIGGSAKGEKAKETINEANDVVIKNSARIAKVQSEINELLEQL